VLGPDALRAGSAGLRRWHPTLGFDVLAGAVDGGDLSVDPWIEAGAVPIVVGGDSGLARREASVLVLDAHPELAWLTSAVEEGAIAPERTLVAGVRGPLGVQDELEAVRALGIEVMSGDELRAAGPGEYSERVLARTAGASCFLSVDLDVVDPAFAPAVATPEVAGLLPHELITLLRSLAGTPFVGFQLSGLVRSLEGPAQITSVLAANLVWEMLALRVLSAP